MPLIRKTPEAAGDERQPAVRADDAASTNQRWQAARQLGGAPGDIETLATALRDETVPRVREAIFTSLVRAGTDQCVEVVRGHLRSDDAGLRTGALDALRAMPLAVGAHMASLLSERDPDVRLLACELARGLPQAGAVDLLCGLLDREKEPNVCAAAIEVLAEIGLPAAVPALERCAARFADETFVAFSVRMAIDRIGAPAPERSG